MHSTSDGRCCPWTRNRAGKHFVQGFVAESYFDIQAAGTLRLAGGPEEAHEILIAKNVLGRWHAGEIWDFGN